ncbi:hypothetical protein DPEC_G00100530 [Dallia pectoralis]|uniref:Uncharacterized protein n=1 Tax=Dallia pectoralis TaxID=75939 RepID=A0ACC2GXI4_DALPE|nr:hypothetical protein DPEC_G00100530 [Dallia pectoralis]
MFHKLSCSSVAVPKSGLQRPLLPQPPCPCAVIRGELGRETDQKCRMVRPLLCYDRVCQIQATAKALPRQCDRKNSTVCRHVCVRSAQRATLRGGILDTEPMSTSPHSPQSN